ncbi:MAG TPA: hypothetical protein VFB51_03780 [Solirubrobacterales bacterium]|nr:hypothetical protein [Solirubrobacterales bacterium]
MEDGLLLADALDVAAIRLVESMQGQEDEPVDEEALSEASVVAGGCLERFWDWREHHPDHALPESVRAVFFCADVIAESLERLLVALHAADRETVIVKWLATSGACEQYERRRIELATPEDFARHF